MSNKWILSVVNQFLLRKASIKKLETIPRLKINHISTYQHQLQNQAYPLL